MGNEKTAKAAKRAASDSDEHMANKSAKLENSQLNGDSKSEVKPTPGGAFDIIKASRALQLSVRGFYKDSFTPSLKSKYTPQFITNFANFLTVDSRSTMFWGQTLQSRAEWIDFTTNMMNDCPTYPDCRVEELSNHVIFASDEYCLLEVKETYFMDDNFKMTTIASILTKKDSAGPGGVRCLYYQETKDEANTIMPDFGKSNNE